MSENSIQKIDWLPPLLARLTLATAFLVSGTGKFRHLGQDAAYFKQLGIPAAKLMVPLVASLEVSCGSLLAAGLFTREAAVPLIPIMGVAIATARRKDIHSIGDLTGVFEFSYILLLAYLITYGGGRLSVDYGVRKALERGRPASQRPSRKAA